jgi:membrane fusion protein (multidrug efflux system)
VRLEAVGTAQAARSAALHPETAGEVVAVNFFANDLVEQDTVLIQLDDEAERLDVELARVRLDDARRTFDRLEKLSASGTSTQAALDEARTALRSAGIALRQAEVALADRVVRAPFTGHIGLTDIEPGDRVDPDDEIATLDDRSALLVRFDVPEALLGQIRPGSAITVAPWTGAIRADGAVMDVDSRIDPDSRSFRVRARIENTDDTLRPGMSFRVTLDLSGARWPAVPEIAIQWGGDGAFLWTVLDGKAKRVPVTILQRQEARVLIDAEIEAGDPVVVEGLHVMREGRPVSVTIREQPVAAESGA